MSVFVCVSFFFPFQFVQILFYLTRIISTYDGGNREKCNPIEVAIFFFILRFKYTSLTFLLQFYNSVLKFHIESSFKEN